MTIEQNGKSAAKVAWQHQYRSKTAGDRWYNCTAEEAKKALADGYEVRAEGTYHWTQPTRHLCEPSHWSDSLGNTITAELKAYNETLGGAPAAASAHYSEPLYRHPAVLVQPQGEPVAYRVIFSDGEHSRWEDGAPQPQDLYDVRDGVISGVQCAYGQPAVQTTGSAVAEGASHE
ncbi:hypothetical protein KVG88_30140 [Pseudomonas sp. SWRI74]|uniref:Uncharacterized protein n=1 Tax=Pseudomonas azerbaijanoccidentalis TaxID=2842347 RepID=A0ABS6QZJ4_9PSED|nr:hypothetical protein [Pseudomonas azerbaijanoccidentalis]MBV4524336.1 hypothetical protein [Pseudomonas azerbaijanoccidentalis]